MRQLVFTCLFLYAHLPLLAQREPTEMKWTLSDDGSRFLKATFLNQVWVRFNQSNPGTTVLGESQDKTVDIGLRRTRFQFYGALTNHVSFYFQFGQNNFNYLSQNGGNRKLQAFFHDALAEYRPWANDQLIVGTGLTITNGLSRFSQPGISSIMSLDVPVFAQATVDQTDEFSRKLSLFARGQLGHLDYRVVLSDPFPVSTNGQTPPPISGNATFALNGHHKQYQGLLIWNFLEREPHTTPYMAGTYLGKKRILNLEGGFIVQKNATWTGDTNTQQYHPMYLWSLAMFYDTPLNVTRGNAVSAYAGYFHTDYGPGYLRYNGIMNPANSVDAPFASGMQGNAFPMFGTGSVWYLQAGYLMRKELLGSKGTLMPFITMQRARYERLPAAMTVWDAGVSWLINGHSSKISIDTQLRPTYTPGSEGFTKNAGWKLQTVVQYQVFF